MQERSKLLFHTSRRCFSTWGPLATKAMSVLGNYMDAELFSSSEAKTFHPHQCGHRVPAASEVLLNNTG